MNYLDNKLNEIRILYEQIENINRDINYKKEPNRNSEAIKYN